MFIKCDWPPVAHDEKVACLTFGEYRIVRALRGGRHSPEDPNSYVMFTMVPVIHELQFRHADITMFALPQFTAHQ